MTLVDAAPLRVVLLAGQMGLGGTERQLALLAQGLSEAGHEVFVVTLYEDGPHAEALRAIGVDVRGPLAPAGRPRPVRAVVALLRLFLLLRSLRPHVLHAFLLAACAVAGPAAVLARVPVRVAGRRSLGDWKDGRPVSAFVERLTNTSFTAFVANAEAVAADSMRRERLPAERVCVIRNALPTDAFVPGAAPRDISVVSATSPVVVCVANLIDYKGQRYLMEAQHLLHTRGVQVQVLLVGEGPERARLAEQARQRGLPLSLLGARTDVTAVLSLADVFVLPSLHEGMSNALMEAMAQGCPVIATDVGGNREVVGDAGILCPPADSGALAAALLSVLENPEVAMSLRASALKRAEEQFGLSRLVDQHVLLYEHLRSGARPDAATPLSRTLAAQEEHRGRELT